MMYDTEREKACAIADASLQRCDSETEDPDSDRSILSRQYLRAIEKIYRLSTILTRILAENDERNSPIRGYTIEDLNCEAADRWPTPPEEK